MKATPVIQLGPDNIVILPLQPKHLVPLASEATLAAVHSALVPLASEATLTAVHSALVPLASEATLAAVLSEFGKLPKASTRAQEITIDLTAAQVDYPLPILPLTIIQTVIVKNLAGAAVTLKLGDITESPLTIIKGEVRDGFELTRLHLSSPGGAGGTITLELHGR